MPYDPATGTMILFGGDNGFFQGTNAFADTWSWNGTTRTKMSPATSPPARDSAAMAYDPATRTMVLFGGSSNTNNGGTFLGDTWTWNGATWTQLSPATSPPARGGASMAHDPATGAMVLFGGFPNGNAGGSFGDTWSWDGTTWIQASPATSPPARNGAAMAYDAATGTVVLFGGGSGVTDLGDTWSWDGTGWTQLSPATSPPARQNASMAYDPATGAMALFGGKNGGDLSDTWSWANPGRRPPRL